MLTAKIAAAAAEESATALKQRTLKRIQQLKAACETIIDSTLAESSEAFEKQRTQGLKQIFSDVRQMNRFAATLRKPSEPAAAAAVGPSDAASPGHG